MPSNTCKKCWNLKNKNLLGPFWKSVCAQTLESGNIFTYPQIWRQKKLFCIIADEQEIFLNTMISTIETIAAAYEKRHEIRIVPSPEHCPNDHYSVVINYGKNPGFEGFESIFSKLINSSSKSQFIDFGAQLAFTIFLPGGTKRSFIFINKIETGIHSNLDY